MSTVMSCFVFPQGRELLAKVHENINSMKTSVDSVLGNDSQCHVATCRNAHAPTSTTARSIAQSALRNVPVAVDIHMLPNP